MGVEPAFSPAPRGLESLEPVLDVLPSPLILVELGTARIVYANKAAHRLAGGLFPLGADADDYPELYHLYDPEGRPLPVEEAPAVRAARGETLSRVQVGWDTPAGRLTVMASADSILLPGGERMAVVTFEDVTELEAARRRATLLADAGSRLAATLDYDATLAAVGDLVVGAYADWCFVELKREHGGIERALIRHADPAKRAFVEEYDRRFPLDPDAPLGSPQVIRTGVPSLATEIPDALLEQVASHPDQLRLLRLAGFRSALVVPLRVRGEVIGDLALAYAESGRRFTEDDVPVVQALADRCALALENARLFTELRAAEERARSSRDEFRAMLESVPDAVFVQAPDLRIVYLNTAAEQMFAGPDPGDTVQHFRSLYELLDDDGGALDLARLPGRRVLAGEAPEPLIVRYRDRRTGATGWARVLATPVRDAGGAVRLAINLAEDVTEARRALEAQRFLAEASRLLAGSLDYEATLPAIADLAVPEMADWCVVDLVGPGGRERVAIAHADPALVARAQEIQRRYGRDRRGVAEVLRDGRARLWPEIDDDLLREAAQDETHLRLLREVGMRSAMVVPIALRGKPFGTISFVSADSGRRFDAHDLAVAEDLGLRAAAAVENARLYRTARGIARTLQTTLLPPSLPAVPGHELAAAYRPAGEGLEVGGDFYDAFSTAEQQWYLVIGDVCGKGAAAAAVTALARWSIRSAAVRRRSPAAILRWLADVMLREQDDGGRFATVACAHLDLSRPCPRVTVACGGHPLPVVLRADGTAEELGAPGTLLGLVEDPVLQERSTDLRPGDALVLYTDGLTEARAPEVQWGPEDLLAAARGAAGRPAAGIVEHLVAAALDGQPAPRDDLAMLVARAAG